MQYMYILKLLLNVPKINVALAFLQVGSGAL